MNHRGSLAVVLLGTAAAACTSHDAIPFEPMLVQRGEGRSLSFPGHSTTMLWRGQSPDGGVTVLEITVAPGTLGAPPHVHGHEDEYFYVVEGSPTFLVGDIERTVGQGTLGALPRGRRHAFWNSGTTMARILVTIVPGRFGKFFEDVSEELRTKGITDRAEVARIVEDFAARYGCKVFSEQVGPLIESRGLR